MRMNAELTRGKYGVEIRGWEAKQHEKDFALSAKKSRIREKEEGREGGGTR